MSDNVTPLPNKKHGGAGIKRVLLFLGILLVVCALVAVYVFRDSLNLDALRRWFAYLNVKNDDTYGVYTFDAHNNNRYASFQNGLAVASVGGLETYDSGGSQLGLAQAQMRLPAIQTGGGLVMAYDVGGNTLLALDRRGSEVLRLTESKAIWDADISAGGAICYSTSASGYKSVLTVYDKNQTRIYRWLSSTTYMPLCAVSEDAHTLAAVGLSQSDGAYESTLYLFETNSEDVKQSVSLGGDLIYDLFYMDGGALCAVGESQVQFLDSDGTPAGSYAYGDAYLKDFDAGGNGFLTLTVNMYKAGNRYSLVTVDETGSELASLYIGREILDVSACGKYIAVLTSGDLTIYTSGLTVYDQTEDIGAATSALMREDGSVLLLGNGQGRLYIP